MATRKSPVPAEKKTTTRKSPTTKAVAVKAQPVEPVAMDSIAIDSAAADSAIAKRIPTYEEIAILAEQLWNERGRPFGSPEVDWLRAEATLYAA